MAEKKEKKDKQNDAKNEKQVSDVFAQTIKKYLDNFAAENPLFAEKYKNEKKSIKRCCGYICDEVIKMGVQCLTDDEVYYLARHYYEEEEIKGSSYNSRKVVVNHQVKLTDEEIAKAKEDALAQIKNEEIQRIKKEQEKQNIAEEKKLLKEKKKAELAKEKEKESGQLNLFDLLGGE